MRVIQHLLKAIRDVAVFNPDVQDAPACILWPDRDRQWEAAIPRLQGELPELLILGNYEPEKRIGPAIWLRCVIAGKTDDVMLPEGCTPIFYLPGVSRQDLRAVESCPDNLKPLAELQYRGVIWSQINAKDWTILAFLKSDQGGLGLDVAQDNETKNAMQLALYRLLDEDIELLKDKRLEKDYFNTLLTGGDPVRELLQWIDQGDAFQSSRGENEWKAFVEVCKSQLAFNPQNDGILSAAARLATHEGPWNVAWERFCEAPKRYPNIAAQIRKCNPPSDTIFWHTGDGNYDGWPQWNEEQEKNLCRDLLALKNMPAHEARNRIQEMEKQHGSRRQLIWSELGEAALALSMEHLSLLAGVTKNSLAAGSAEDLAVGYAGQGWRADDAVIRALSPVDKTQDLEAVTTAVRAVYLPWAEDSARHLQRVWDNEITEKQRRMQAEKERGEEAACILFVDGLRFDCGKRLTEILEQDGYSIAERVLWSTLPSVTGTGKPAVAPIIGKNTIAEEPEPYNFEPMTPYQFKKTIEDNGWKIVGAKDPIPSPIHSPDGNSIINRIWCEIGNIDHEGHDRGWKLARHIGSLLGEIRDRINALLDAGWKEVRVVTDHGWLLLPGGLPKIEMPSALVESKWGRCAAIKPGAVTEERLYPWFWNTNQHFALADGISCYRKGEEYAHGGLSLQECLTLELTVTRAAAGSVAISVEITDIVWKGLRCTVAVTGQFYGLSVDIRRQPGNASSSVVVGIKPLKGNGTASVVVENEELEGLEATLVLLDPNGGLVAQVATVIGGGDK
jgi:hypothetical protein